MTLPYYGFITALALDPIEKKPLYHFRPGVTILSAGFALCNLHCPFCQNWEISQKTDVQGRFYTPEELIEETEAHNCAQIAYTYSEPLIHSEYLCNCMALAHERGIANVLVSNGCVNEEAAKDVLALTDAANIDLKCFSEETYSRVLGGNLDAVCKFVGKGLELGVRLELTTLIVPGLNDGPEEIDRCIEFIAGLEAGSASPVPWHLSAYHPAYKWNAPPTSTARLIEIARRARERLGYVYTGNIRGGLEDTACPGCGATLVRRRGYYIDKNALVLSADGKSYICAHCGKPAPFVLF
jgi:pyruvate formate lyase activating enzyme